MFLWSHYYIITIMVNMFLINVSARQITFATCSCEFIFIAFQLLQMCVMPIFQQTNIEQNIYSFITMLKLHKRHVLCLICMWQETQHYVSVCVFIFFWNIEFEFLRYVFWTNSLIIVMLWNSETLNKLISIYLILRLVWLFNAY